MRKTILALGLAASLSAFSLTYNGKVVEGPEEFACARRDVEKRENLVLIRVRITVREKFWHVQFRRRRLVHDARR